MKKTETFISKFIGYIKKRSWKAFFPEDEGDWMSFGIIMVFVLVLFLSDTPPWAGVILIGLFVAMSIMSCARGIKFGTSALKKAIEDTIEEAESEMLQEKISAKRIAGEKRAD